LEEFLPIGGDEWDMVERNHAKYYPKTQTHERVLTSKICILFISTRVLTGDPNCPPEVRRAKYIHEEIKKRSGLSDGEAVRDGERQRRTRRMRTTTRKVNPQIEVSDHPAGCLLLKKRNQQQ
jgi:hypothetical protein